jgi:hypothetical protein
MSDEFGDFDLDDAATEGDADVDWTQVEELADKYAQILAIEDEEERLFAAEALMAELNR